MNGTGLRQPRTSDWSWWKCPFAAGLENLAHWLSTTSTIVDCLPIAIADGFGSNLPLDSFKISLCFSRELTMCISKYVVQATPSFFHLMNRQSIQRQAYVQVIFSTKTMKSSLTGYQRPARARKCANRVLICDALGTLSLMRWFENTVSDPILYLIWQSANMMTYSQIHDGQRSLRHWRPAPVTGLRADQLGLSYNVSH